MKLRALQAIDPAARLRLERCVRQAEHGGAGEIAVTVVRACDDYDGVGWRLGVVLAAVAFLSLANFAPPLPAWAYLSAQAFGLLAARGLARLDAVRRRLLSRGLVEQHVAARARRCFAERGLGRAHQQRGLLIFVALFERRVVVLAGDGFDGTLDSDGTWAGVVEQAIAGLREGRAADGLEAAVQRCGEILAQHRSPGAADADALRDKVVVEE